MKKIILLFLIFVSCSLSQQNSKQLDIRGKKTYKNYILDGFYRVPVDIIMIEKKIEGYDINIEFHDDLKTIHLKRWLFRFDDSLSLRDNVLKVVEKYNMKLVSSICEVDSSYYTFNLVTTSNILLQGKILKDTHSNFIEIVYYFPKY